MNKLNKNRPGHKKTKVDWIPEGWRECKLGELFVKRTERGRAGLPVLSVTVNNGLIKRDSIDRKMDTNLEPKAHLLVKKNDIAYNMMRMWQGASGIVDYDGLISPAYIVLNPRKSIDPHFAAHWFKSARMIYLFWAYSYGLTGDRLRLYFKDLSLIPVLLPPLLEQKIIVGISSTWDLAIKKTGQLIATKEDMLSVLLRTLIIDQCLYNNKQWKRIKLSNVVKIQIGKTPSRSNNSFWDTNKETNNIWLSVSDLAQGRYVNCSKEHISDKAVSECSMKIIPEGTVIMSFKLTLGRTCILRKAAFTNEAIAAFLPVNNEFEPVFLLYLLPTINWDSLVDQAAKGKTLNKSKLNDVEIPCPPLNQQRKIAKILNTAQQEIYLLKKLAESYSTQKRGLMQKLLTGKWRVKLSEEADL